MESLLPLQHWGPHHLCERALQLPGGQREGNVSGGAGWLARAPLRRMMWHQHGQKGACSPGQVYTLPKGREQVQVYHRGNPRASVRLRGEYHRGGWQESSGRPVSASCLGEPPRWCQSQGPPRPPCVLPALQGAVIGRKRPHTHLIQTPNLTRQGRPSRGARSSLRKHGLAEVKEAKLWLHLASFLLCLMSPSYKTH